MTSISLASSDLPNTAFANLTKGFTFFLPAYVASSRLVPQPGNPSIYPTPTLRSSLSFFHTGVNWLESIESDTYHWSSGTIMPTTEMKKEQRKRKGSAPEAEDLLEFFEKKKRRKEEEEEEEKRVPKREPEEEVLRAMEKLFGSEFTQPVWLGEKKLTKTDVHQHHQRFFFPHCMIERLKPHLKAWEKGEIEPRDGPGVPVTIMDTLSGDWELRLKRWASLQQFALLQGWKPLVKVNELKDEERLGVWAYRHGPLHKLGFILRRLH